jgi:ABC-type uncharacterized transport system fused permease/ATPase subunit
MYRIGGVRLASIAVLTLARTALLNYQGKVQGHLFKTAFLKQVGPFTQLLLKNVILSLIASSVERTGMHIQDVMAIKWRNWMTERLHAKYFANMVLSHARESMQQAKCIFIFVIGEHVTIVLLRLLLVLYYLGLMSTKRLAFLYR